MTKGKLHEADYVLPHSSMLFNLSSAIVPFVDSDSGNRVSMAVRHMEQSISLQDRDKPLVQVVDPSGSTFEQTFGKQVAHTAPAAGKVVEVSDNHIRLKDAKGVEHKIHLYNYYPLNDTKSVLHSTPLVKVGDKVEAGQVVADNNYTREGTLALGKNLRVAYMPFHGMNFEDSLVITESAAKKLASVHLHKHEVPIAEQTIIDTKKYLQQHPGSFSNKQLTHIGEDGVVKVGAKVRPGDPMVLAMQPYSVKDRVGLGALRKSLTNQFTDKALRWDSDHEGEVVAVHRGPEGVQVHVKTIEPMQVADKMSNRHGGKGVVGYIIPDHEAPKDKDGKPVDVLFNPLGVGGRMNVGQILETMAGKVAQKTGETYKVTNFDPHNKDRVEHMQSLLRKHGISDTEELFDPKTGQSYGQVLTGPQHFIKLVHQADKKLSVRSGMGLPKLPSDEKYDSMTFQPAGGGGTGGQSYGQLGMYALLAHGATNLLREAMTVKSQGEDPETNEAKRWKTGHADAWIAMQKGLPLPPPRPTFAFHRFTELLKAAGVNMEKKGSELMLSPMTDKQILSTSKGEVVNPTAAVHAKIDPQTNHYKTIKGGLFDDQLTGGHGGTHWTHVALTEPMPNPLFEDPIKKLTGLTKSSFEAILYGHKQVLPSTGALVDKGGVTGGEGIKALLKNIDVKKELRDTLAKLKKAPASSVDELYRKASYLQGLDKLGLRPEEAYILHNVPVLPPKLRPLSIMEDGALRYEDLNGFYMNIGQLNSALTRLQDMPDKVKADTRKGMYEGISALFGAHALPEGAKVKGILHQIAGSSPKEGLFQKGLLSPRQDATMRGVIIPGPDLHLDQVGLPKHAALVQYRPFVIKHMVQSGLAKTELDAQLMLSEVHQGKRQEMGVWRALERAVAERPILLKRDPALHKESILAFKPVLIEGNSIKLHPLVSGGFNADHDGDSCLGEVTYLQVSEQTTEVRQVNLADFPRLEDTKKTTGSVDVYQTPAGIYVMGNWLGRTQPCLVTEYSVHRDLEMVVVGLGNHQKVKCSQDHSLATLNPRTLLIERTSPADALGRAVPLVSLNQGHLTDSIACGGVLYQATADLGRQLGSLWASPVRDLGPGWEEILPDILQKALALPLVFRKAFVREVLSERLDRTSGEVLTSDGKERSELSWLLSSCGLASRVRDHKLKLDLLTLLRADWLTIPGKHLCSWADRFKVYVPEWVRQELKIPSSSDWLSRKYVTRYLGRVSEVSGYLRAWRELCYENAGFWTRVASVKNTGDKVTMYDLTVEGALNFALSTGVVVWDTMSGYVPADEASIREAQRMFPSKNIFNEATTAPSHVPTMEARLGLHRLGKVGDATSHKFDTHSQAIDALALQKVKLSDQIQVGGKTTTPGRILLATAVPEPFKAKVLHDFDAQMDTKGLKSLFAEVGKKTPEEYTKFADAMKDLGNATSTGMIRSALTAHPVIAVGAHSYRLQDFSTDKAVRDPILQQAHDKVRTIQGLKITDVEKERRTVDTYLSAFQEINKAHLAKEKTAPVKNNLLTMTEAGVKPSKDQYAQMRIAPGIMKDSKGTLLPTPIQRSYGEGLTLSEYWTGTYGARSGSVKKVQEVQEPGYMTKLLQNTSMGMLIDSHDCGTTQGRLMPITHADVADRHLASELKIGGMHLPAGTLLSKDVVDQIRSLDPQAQIHVRSPLHCHSEKGVCQKCFGLAANGHHHPQGTNVGVLSAHALGERAVQLTLKAFHCMDRHTLVLCRRGERVFHTTLGELFEEGGPSAREGAEEWRTLSEVTEVWDYEGWTRIVRAGRHPQQAGTRMVLSRASDGAGILSQDNHPHMLLRREGAEMQAVPPAEVRQGDHFLRATEPEPTYTAPPLQQGWLAGIYCAEGSLIVRQQHERDYLVGIQISQKNTSPVYPRILEALCKEYGPGRYGASGRYFQVYGKERAEHFAQTFRRYSRNIGLPAGWSGYPRQWLLDFVSGMFDGDGSVYQPKDGGSRWRARMETTSWRLVQQVRHILAKEGVPVRVDVTPWRKLSRNQGFSLSLTVTQRVRELLACSTKIQSCNPIASAGLGSSPPIFIKEVRFEEPPWVYDIETETHTFFANGILTHNSGGSVSSRSGGALGAFQRLEQLTYLPDKIPNAATMSRASGEITKITPTSTGTEIHIGDQVHFVGKDREGRPLHVHLPEEDKAPGYKPWTPPKVGMKVERGQTLTDPNRTLINPHRLYEATGDMTKVQHFLADELHNIYSDEGVRKRAVEVVVRAMGNVTKIHEPHDHEGLLRGQFYPKTAVDKINQERTLAGKPAIEHSPALIGVDLLPLAATQDWLAVLNHQKLRSTLKRNAAMGAVSNIHGPHPIPGLAFGVEFGKPPAGSKTPY
jgi:DNA-directed RNA polymerase beta' subunit